MKVVSVVLDTSFLITYASDARVNHATAKRYFEESIRAGVRMLVPTVVVAEFERKQAMETLGLHNFSFLPFNLDDAGDAAKFAEKIKPAAGDRLCFAADIKIIAQAHRAGATAILTEDAETMASYVRQLRELGEISVHYLLLSDGFDPSLLRDPSSPSLPLDL